MSERDGGRRAVATDGGDERDLDVRIVDPPTWTGPSSDPNDEQFGDVVEAAALDGDDTTTSASAFAAVLVGEPYDGGVIGRPGAAEGPEALREALAGVKTHHFDAGPVGSVGDLGDVELPASASVADAQDAASAVAARVHDADALPVFLGGDNSLTYANVRPLLDRGRVGVVSLDAHLDCRALDDGPSSGTPYRQLFEGGLDALAVLGARHFETSTAYHRYADEHGATILTADAVGADPDRAVVRARDAMAGVDHCYVSLDLDALDAAAAPGVSAPTPGGLTTRELYGLLDDLAATGRLAGFEVVECAPPLDRGERTARAGARAVAHVLAARQSGRGDRQETIADATGERREGGDAE